MGSSVLIIQKRHKEEMNLESLFIRKEIDLRKNSLIMKSYTVIAVLLMTVFTCRAQFTGCSTGLLQMPTADMQDDGTFMITNNYLNQHATSTRWNYDTFQYGIHVSFWNRIELGYVCTIFNDYWQGSQSREGVWMINQDRHFVGRVCLLREGEFGLNWMPALVLGVCDPTTGSSGYEYSKADVSGSGNGYFNRNYLVMTKHIATPAGVLGVHAGYQYNRRTDYPINGLCAGVNWQPIWLMQRGILDRMDVIVEYDSRTVNLGFIASVWGNRFEAMFELQNFRWVNFGLRYKLRLKKVTD